METADFIYTGEVYHKRFKPFAHDFKYPSFTIFCEWDTSSSSKLFSKNKFNLFSLFEKDHGKRDGSSVKDWIFDEAQNRGLDTSNLKLFFLGYPRLLGFVFNPLSIFFLMDNTQKIHAIIYEVKNTFGHQHSYFIIPQENKTHKAQKIFHVSPFMSLDCEYEFEWKNTPPEQNFELVIRQKEKDEFMFIATMNGKAEPLNDKTLLKTALKYPFLTLGVLWAIHWQALKLWIKGAKYHPVPKPPSQDFS